MNPIVSKEIEAYAVQNSFPEAELFRKLKEETYQNTEMPQMQVGPLEGAFLRAMVRLTRARRILEIGTFTGYSTLAMAEALPEGGEIFTCDCNAETTAMARKFWDQSPNGGKIHSIFGAALETIPTISGEFDLVFIDADKENYPSYWNLLADRVRKGGVILADNTLWSGRVLQPSDDEDRGIVEYNRKASSDPRFESVLLTIRDGVMMSLKI